MKNSNYAWKYTTYLYVFRDNALVSHARSRINIPLRINLDPAPVQFHASARPTYKIVDLDDLLSKSFLMKMIGTSYQKESELHARLARKLEKRRAI